MNFTTAQPCRSAQSAVCRQHHTKMLSGRSEIDLDSNSIDHGETFFAGIDLRSTCYCYVGCLVNPLPQPRDVSMLVVVHDFSSVFLQELTHITQVLQRLVGRCMTAAIVPRWHGHCGCRTQSAYTDLLPCYDEHMLHGWTHHSGSYWRPLSLMTGSADEFRGMSPQRIAARLENAHQDFHELTGGRARGLLPPAWQLPVSANQLYGFEYVMRYGSLQSCDRVSKTLPLATYSWDWGRLGWLGYGGELLGDWSARGRQEAAVCIAIHPIDVARGYFARAVQRIENLLDRGVRASTPAELLALTGESP